MNVWPSLLIGYFEVFQTHFKAATEIVSSNFLKFVDKQTKAKFVRI